MAIKIDTGDMAQNSKLRETRLKRVSILRALPQSRGFVLRAVVAGEPFEGDGGGPGLILGPE